MEEEFWKPQADLKHQFLERLKEMGGNNLAITCIDTFFAFDGSKSWKPSQVLLREVARVIDVGLVLSIIGQSNLSSEYKIQINESLKTGSTIPPDLWSELLVASFLKHCGAAVQFVPRGRSKTPDLSCFCNEIQFDVEVTRAKMKASHSTVEQSLNDFVDALKPGDFDWHIICFVSDGSSNKILDSTFEAALKLHPGECAGEQGLWSVIAVPLADRDTVISGQSTELFAPRWWPKNQPTFFTTTTLLNGKGNPVCHCRI